ncbi:hypothetical protein ROSMUCSMR3_02934 [Roseovarius mucosus]|uniref:Uncharacterized protein n=2 Tax=Roseovarius mucosus TaxID=215743 RepID=A0A1V0RRK3_9RHOB|nr:hypothetical protein ROSMUCSMR3_02934 [Roseovarius mucosus]
MVKGSKTHFMGLTGNPMGTRRKVKRGSKVVETYKKRIKFNVVTSLRVSGQDIKAAAYKRKFPLYRDPELDVRTATAVASIYEAMAATVLPSSPQITQAKSPYAGLTALESDDMWFGHPKDMSDEDLAFFGLEK